MTALTALKSQRDALIRELLAHPIGAVIEDRGGWATDRFDALNAIEWDMMEAGFTGRRFVWACYLARLLKHGKTTSFRPTDRYRGK